MATVTRASTPTMSGDIPLRAEGYKMWGARLSVDTYFFPLFHTEDFDGHHTWHDMARSKTRAAAQHCYLLKRSPQASESQSPPESIKPTYPPDYEDYVDPPQYSLPPRRMKRKTVNPHILPPPTYSEDPIPAAPPSSSTKPEPAIKQKKPPHFKLMVRAILLRS
ncbi:hypothetical protein DFP72DRAFT_1072843 [Ephemerocybe angulata]|uniref:Uncharacterized protein n=1 Tax=Ephemerocybe angulata TaxID=980116 RepID=A0A8H6HNW1_9AGAR|nr:hypothetical protein DFP72DRAFT_1072843 [Tulosesus angulatus]